MFEKLDKMYFGERHVKSVVEDAGRSRVIITYADDKKPTTEEMHISEWEEGRSEHPIEKPPEKQAWFVKRTAKLRQAVVDLVVSYNPRFGDMKKVVAWIEEGISMTYRNVVSRVFGLKNFDTDATVELVAARLEKSRDITADWTPLEKEMFVLIRKNGIKVNEITTQAFLGGLQTKIEGVINECVAEALGGSDEARRCDDIERLIKQHTLQKLDDKV